MRFCYLTCTKSWLFRLIIANFRCYYSPERSIPCRYACTEDQPSRHLARNKRRRPFSDKKLHTFFVNCSWPCLWTPEQNEESLCWSYLDFKQPQCKTTLFLGVCRSLKSCKRLWRSVPKTIIKKYLFAPWTHTWKNQARKHSSYKAKISYWKLW